MQRLVVVIQSQLGLMSGVYRDFCHCNLVGLRDSLDRIGFPQQQGWHHLGAFCANLMWRCHLLFSCNCRYSRLKWLYPNRCNRCTMDVFIAIESIRTTIHVLDGNPPSVPLSGVLLV